MIVRDQFGYLHEVPNLQFVGAGESPLGEAVYDGFGNPVGAFPALAALLPMIPSALHGLFSTCSPPPPPSSAPPPPPPLPPTPAAPAPIMMKMLPEQTLRRRRTRRRRMPVRARVERRMTEQLTVPPLRATESSGGLSGYGGWNGQE